MTTHGVQVGSVTRVRSANVTPATSSAINVRRAAAMAARTGGSVTVTTVTVNPPAPVAPRVATVRRLPHRHLPKRRTGWVAATTGVVVAGTAAVAGFGLGFAGVGLLLLQTLAGLVLLAVVTAVAYTFLACGCPGIHCGGCRG